MAFDKKAPDWKAEGIQPPLSKREIGWEVEDRPPAAWLNWYMNTASESIQELQTKAAEKTYVDEQISEIIEGIEVNIPDASLTQKGISKLNSAVNNSSETEAATPKAVKTVNDSLTAHAAESATLTTKGHTQLSSSVTSTSEALAATPKAVKTVMDRADAAFTSASDGKTAVASAVTAKGVAASPADTFPTLAAKIGQISTGKKWARGAKTATTSRSDFELARSTRRISSLYLFVSDLDFTPSVIVMQTSTPQHSISVYSEIHDGYYQKTVKTMTINGDITQDYNMYIYKGDVSPALIASNGFWLPIGADTAPINVEWIAFEK